MLTKNKTFLRSCRLITAIGVLLAAYFGGDVRAAQAQEQQAPMPINLFMDAERFYAGAPLLLHYQIKNTHRFYQAQITSEFKDASWLELRLYDALGNEIPIQAGDTNETKTRRDGLPLRSSDPKKNWGIYAMPLGGIDGSLRLHDRYPTLKPGKYRLSVRASLMVTQSRPPNEAVSAKQKAQMEAEPDLLPPATGTLRQGATLRFTILPADAATLKARAAMLREIIAANSPVGELHKSVLELMAWPHVTALDEWRPLLKDERFTKMRANTFVNAIVEAARHNDLNAIRFLGVITWESEMPSRRVWLQTIRATGDEAAKKLVEAMFAAHGEIIPSNAMTIQD